MPAVDAAQLGDEALDKMISDDSPPDARDDVLYDWLCGDGSATRSLVAACAGGNKDVLWLHSTAMQALRLGSNNTSPGGASGEAAEPAPALIERLRLVVGEAGAHEAVGTLSVTHMEGGHAQLRGWRVIKRALAACLSAWAKAKQAAAGAGADLPPALLELRRVDGNTDHPSVWVGVVLQQGAAHSARGCQLTAAAVTNMASPQRAWSRLDAPGGSKEVFRPLEAFLQSYDPTRITLDNTAFGTLDLSDLADSAQLQLMVEGSPVTTVTFQSRALVFVQGVLFKSALEHCFEATYGEQDNAYASAQVHLRRSDIEIHLSLTLAGEGVPLPLPLAADDLRRAIADGSKVRRVVPEKGQAGQPASALWSGVASGIELETDAVAALDIAGEHCVLLEVAEGPLCVATCHPTGRSGDADAGYTLSRVGPLKHAVKRQLLAQLGDQAAVRRYRLMLQRSPGKKTVPEGVTRLYDMRKDSLLPSIVLTVQAEDGKQQVPLSHALLRQAMRFTGQPWRVEGGRATRALYAAVRQDSHVFWNDDVREALHLGSETGKGACRKLAIAVGGETTSITISVSATVMNAGELCRALRYLLEERVCSAEGGEDDKTIALLQQADCPVLQLTRGPGGGPLHLAILAAADDDDAGGSDASGAAQEAPLLTARILIDAARASDVKWQLREDGSVQKPLAAALEGEARWFTMGGATAQHLMSGGASPIPDCVQRPDRRLVALWCEGEKLEHRDGANTCIKGEDSHDSYCLACLGPIKRALLKVVDGDPARWRNAQIRFKLRQPSITGNTGAALPRADVDVSFPSLDGGELSALAPLKEILERASAWAGEGATIYGPISKLLDYEREAKSSRESEFPSKVNWGAGEGREYASDAKGRPGAARGLKAALKGYDGLFVLLVDGQQLDHVRGFASLEDGSGTRPDAMTLSCIPRLQAGLQKFREGAEGRDLVVRIALSETEFAAAELSPNLFKGLTARKGKKMPIFPMKALEVMLLDEGEPLAGFSAATLVTAMGPGARPDKLGKKPSRASGAGPAGGSNGGFKGGAAWAAAAASLSAAADGAGAAAASTATDVRADGSGPASRTKPRTPLAAASGALAAVMAKAGARKGKRRIDEEGGATKEEAPRPSAVQQSRRQAPAAAAVCKRSRQGGRGLLPSPRPPSPKRARRGAGRGASVESEGESSDDEEEDDEEEEEEEWESDESDDDDEEDGGSSDENDGEEGEDDDEGGEESEEASSEDGEGSEEGSEGGGGASASAARRRGAAGARKPVRAGGRPCTGRASPALAAGLQLKGKAAARSSSRAGPRNSPAAAAERRSRPPQDAAGGDVIDLTGDA